MLAVMGPSGCGKTTLLDTLAGRMRGNIKTSGALAVNGHGTSLAFGKAAYVAQEAQLAGALTVRETLLFAARIRLANLTKPEMDELVDRLIEDMGLTLTANTLVGDWAIRGISGGQRRRLSIAVELITSPQILFLDEPTSGLDSAAAFHVLSCVRRLATDERRTVVAVIHQPPSEVYALFDKLLLLSAGRTVYFGDAPKAMELFKTAGLKKDPNMSEVSPERTSGARNPAPPASPVAAPLPLPQTD